MSANQMCKRCSNMYLNFSSLLVLSWLKNRRPLHCDSKINQTKAPFGRVSTLPKTAPALAPQMERLLWWSWSCFVKHLAKQLHFTFIRVEEPEPPANRASFTGRHQYKKKSKNHPGASARSATRPQPQRRDAHAGVPESQN